MKKKRRFIFSLFKIC